jgi:hypothetical protein
MWIILLAAIVIIVIIIIVIIVLSQPSRPTEPTNYTSSPDYTTSEAAAGAVTPNRPVQVAGGNLTTVSGSYIPTLNRNTPADVAQASEEEISQIVKAFRAILPSISQGKDIDGREIEKIITVHNATRVPTRDEARVAYFKMIDPLKQAGKFAEEQLLQTEYRIADKMAERAQRIREIISSGLLCGYGAKDAAILGCTLSPVSTPPCASGWTEIRADHLRDSKLVPLRTYCVQNANPNFSLLTVGQYPDPLRAGTVQGVKIGRK